MNMKKVTAIFKGANGSCGFTHNQQYVLTIKKGENIMVEDETGERYCEYESIIAFLNNWDNVSTIHVEHEAEITA
jgi:hypothetical protein